MNSAQTDRRPVHSQFTSDGPDADKPKYFNMFKTVGPVRRSFRGHPADRPIDVNRETDRQCLNCRGWGVEPPRCLLNPPNKMPWDTQVSWGISFNPPPLLMMLNCLCVMTVTMNRQMSTPHLFFDNSNPADRSLSDPLAYISEPVINENLSCIWQNHNIMHLYISVRFSHRSKDL
jgi:hypothetical protein